MKLFISWLALAFPQELEAVPFIATTTIVAMQVLVILVCLPGQLEALYPGVGVDPWLRPVEEVACEPAPFVAASLSPAPRAASSLDPLPSSQSSPSLGQSA